MYFTNKEKVLSYDCDLRSRMKVSAAMRYMQQAADDHLIALGSAAELLQKEDSAFLLSKISMKIHRMPVLNEPITVGTAPTPTKGVRFVREYVVDSADGDRLISAISYWPLVRISSRKIIRPVDYKYALDFQPELNKKHINDTPFPKLSGPGEIVFVENIKYSGIDQNRHVNNTVYGDIICDALPFDLLSEKDMDRIIIIFQNEAIVDDTITIKRYELADNEYCIVGEHSRGVCFKGLVTFTL